MVITLSELKNLTQVQNAEKLEPGQRYLVTVPDDTTSNEIKRLERLLDEAGLNNSIIVPEHIQFQILAISEEPVKLPWHRNIFRR